MYKNRVIFLGRHRMWALFILSLLHKLVDWLWELLQQDVVSKDSGPSMPYTSSLKLMNQQVRQARVTVVVLWMVTSSVSTIHRSSLQDSLLVVMRTLYEGRRST